jgi:hypothetical protein
MRTSTLHPTLPLAQVPLHLAVRLRTPQAPLRALMLSSMCALSLQLELAAQSWVVAVQPLLLTLMYTSAIQRLAQLRLLTLLLPMTSEWTCLPSGS